MALLQQAGKGCRGVCSCCGTGFLQPAGLKGAEAPRDHTNPFGADFRPCLHDRASKNTASGQEADAVLKLTPILLMPECDVERRHILQHHFPISLVQPDLNSLLVKVHV